MQINVLPRMEVGEVAANMDEIFSPKDCPADTLTIRRGFVRNRSDKVLECVLAYAPGDGLMGLRLLTKAPEGDWELSMGGNSNLPEMEQAITDQIGKYV